MIKLQMTESMSHVENNITDQNGRFFFKNCCSLSENNHFSFRKDFFQN